MTTRGIGRKGEAAAASRIAVALASTSICSKSASSTSPSGVGVAAANCADALGAPNDDLRLVRATTMHQAMRSIEAWVANPDADLPSCEESL